MLRKINGVLAIITSAVLLAHIVIMSLLLSGLIAFRPWFSIVGHVAILLFSVHALLSIIILYFCSESGFSMRYASFNIRTILQRVASILIIILLHFHFGQYTTTAADGSVQFVTPTLMMFLIQALLTALVVLHISVSLPKALITLGITRSDTAIKRAVRICDIGGIMVAVCSILALGVYCFLSKGIVL